MTPAILRVLAVLLLLLGTSLPAHAHDAGAHRVFGHPEQQPSTGGSAIAYRADAGASFSQSCPGLPGHMCCCSSLVTVSSAAKLPVVANPTWRLVVAPAAGDTVQVSSLPALAAQPHSRVQPRAPPVSS